MITSDKLILLVLLGAIGTWAVLLWKLNTEE